MMTFSRWQFTLFRIVFGTYLAIHFAMLIPYAAELFGHEGVLGNAHLNPSAGLFPNPLNWRLSKTVLMGFIAMLVTLSVAFAVGLLRPLAALILWFGWTALFHRNNLISNPSIPYVGLLLILCVLVPTGEPLAFSRKNELWAMPKWVFRTAWILLAAGYSFSGFTKLSSPSWIDGTAMTYLLNNPLARPGWIRDAMLALPDFFLTGLTWFTLVIELTYLPLSLWKRSRPWIWLTLVAMHLGIILVVDFADLSWGMLMIHCFTFDPSWLPAKRGNAILAYDGECLMCSGVIRFIAEEDRGRRVKFTTLQGNGDALESMLVTHDGRVFSESSAVLALLDSLGGHWRALAICGRMMPAGLRNAVYRFIAAHRYAWFGKASQCELPPASVRERLL